MGAVLSAFFVDRRTAETVVSEVHRGRNYARTRILEYILGVCPAETSFVLWGSVQTPLCSFRAQPCLPRTSAQSGSSADRRVVVLSYIPGGSPGHSPFVLWFLVAVRSHSHQKSSQSGRTQSAESPRTPRPLRWPRTARRTFYRNRHPLQGVGCYPQRPMSPPSLRERAAFASRVLHDGYADGRLLQKIWGIFLVRIVYKCALSSSHL